MNKIGLHYGYWTHIWDTDFAHYIKKAAGLGFDIVELNSERFIRMEKDRVEQVRRAADESGAELSFCGGLKEDADMASEDPAKRKQGIENLRAMCEVVRYMGGSSLSGILHGVWPCNFGAPLDDKRPYLERSAASVREAAKMAQDYGVTFNLEIVNRFEQYLLNTAQEGLDFLEMVDMPNVKLLLDTFHMNIEEHSMGGAIQAAGDKLGHFHVGENNRMPPHENGVLNWREITGALKKIGYQGNIVMEPFVQMGGDVGRDINVWRNLVEDTSEENLDRMIVESLAFMRQLMA